MYNGLVMIFLKQEHNTFKWLLMCFVAVVILSKDERMEAYACEIFLRENEFTKLPYIS